MPIADDVAWIAAGDDLPCLGLPMSPLLADADEFVDDLGPPEPGQACPARPVEHVQQLAGGIAESGSQLNHHRLPSIGLAEARQLEMTIGYRAWTRPPDDGNRRHAVSDCRRARSGRTPSYTRAMASPRPWPKLRHEDEWLIELMEGRLANTHKTAEQLRARAQELRAEAAQTDLRGYRHAASALADRYEQAATERAGARSRHPPSSASA